MTVLGTTNKTIRFAYTLPAFSITKARTAPFG